MRVLVAHPGLQHAHRLAEALNERGALRLIWSGVPFAHPAERRQPWERLLPAMAVAKVPRHLRRHSLLFPTARRLAGRMPIGAGTSAAVIHALCRAFDRWVALHIPRFAPDIVVCYENSALCTFRAARRLGAICILDAASIHHVRASQLRGEAEPHDGRRVELQKDEEIGLAHALITCSDLAADSYRDAGVPDDKIFTCALGTELPLSGPRSRAAGEGGVRFAFVGSLIRRKGADILLDAFERVRASHPTSTLTCIGGTPDVGLARRAGRTEGVTIVPFLGQDVLFERLAQLDCLVLPSRFDAFGMVVPEAMAVGLPVIVSDRVGAKMICERRPDAGWIVELSVSSLAEQMQHLAREPWRIDNASRVARVEASNWTWSAYRRRVLETIDTIQDASAAKGIAQARIAA